MKKRLVYISNMAAPYQVRFCEHLQKYFETEFWFYEYIGHGRPDWWKLELPPNCKVIDRLLYKKNGRYVTFEVIRMLKRYNPDIVMLGGFFIPSNYLAYLWAKNREKKVIIFTETLRKRGKLRGKSVLTRLVDFIYRDIDALFAVHDAAAQQMRNVFNRLGRVTHVARYAADIDRYFDHPVRKRKAGYTYIFANRLIDIYNPLLAIEIFAEIHARYPHSILRMNAHGELLPACRDLIGKLGIENSVQFLTEIKHWDDLSLIYRECDILLFPAKFSNGNFTIIECMASGMGIVISDKIIGQASWIRDGENGFLREPDKGQFLHAIQHYIDHPRLFKTHAAINREMVRPLSGVGTAELYTKLIHEKVLD